MSPFSYFSFLAHAKITKHHQSRNNGKKRKSNNRQSRVKTVGADATLTRLQLQLSNSPLKTVAIREFAILPPFKAKKFSSFNQLSASNANSAQMVAI